MRHKRTTALIFSLLFSASAIAVPQTSKQNSDNQKSQPAPMNQGMKHDGMMAQGGMGHEMGGNMMSMMGQMSAHHQQMSTMMNKLMQSMAAIRNETDPAALKAKLDEHDALLKQMHTEMMGHEKMMKNMSGEMKMNCPAVAEKK